jgi:CotS family spore coat protein
VSNYGWKVENAARVMNIVKVTTPKGVFALKKTHIAPERVQFLHEAQLYARDHGFTRMAQFVLTRLGKPYVRRQGETYYATEWLTGNPVNFASTAQVGQLAHALAQFHEATRGLETTGYHPPMEFALEQMLRRRANDLRTLLAEAQRRAQPDEFDSVLLRLAPALREDAERSLKLVDDPQCRAFLERDEDTPGLCHLDVIPGNFVYDAEKRVHLLDLDLATYAPRVLDLAHLLRRSLQVVNWSSEAAYACFLHYNAVRPLTAEEYVLVQALLTFPYRAWRLAASRYRTLRDAAQVEELKDYAQQEERRQAFLNAFAKQVTRRTPN